MLVKQSLLSLLEVLLLNEFEERVIELLESINSRLIDIQSNTSNVDGITYSISVDNSSPRKNTESIEAIHKVLETITEIT